MSSSGEKERRHGKETWQSERQREDKEERDEIDNAKRRELNDIEATIKNYTKRKKQNNNNSHNHIVKTL